MKFKTKKLKQFDQTFPLMIGMILKYYEPSQFKSFLAEALDEQEKELNKKWQRACNEESLG